MAWKGTEMIKKMVPTLLEHAPADSRRQDAKSRILGPAFFFTIPAFISAKAQSRRLSHGLGARTDLMGPGSEWNCEPGVLRSLL